MIIRSKILICRGFQPVTRHKTLEAKEKKRNFHNLPDSEIIKFVGREQALKNLDKQLENSETVAISSKKAISTLTGMGGIGKTELALQYAWADRKRSLEKQTYQLGICWINVADEGNVGTQILNFIQNNLQLPIGEEGELEDKVRNCWLTWATMELPTFVKPSSKLKIFRGFNYFFKKLMYKIGMLLEEKNRRALIIFDDVREYYQIKNFFPPSDLKNFKVIITTREQRLAKDIKLFTVELLDKQASLDLIISLIGEDRVNKELTESKALCKDSTCKFFVDGHKASVLINGGHASRVRLQRHKMRQYFSIF